MNPKETLSKVSKPLFYVGCGLDLLNKLGLRHTGIINGYPLGRDNLLASHIGNFGTSAVLTALVRNNLCDQFEQRYHINISPKLRNLLAFTSIALLNILFEAVVMPIMIGGKNPELIGDTVIGLLATSLYLMSYPGNEKT